jgi:hypothetical protein
MSSGAFVIELQLHAAAGTPLVHERVRLYDPDTQLPVGSEGTTDEDGVFRARVPEEKHYDVHIVESDGEDHPDPFDDHVHPLPAKLPHPDEHPVLHVLFLDAAKAPLKDEPVAVKDEHGGTVEAKTDESGSINLMVEAGPFTLEVRGKPFLAHSVLSGELLAEGAPYKFVVQ